MIVNTGLRRTMGSAVQRLFNSSSFLAELTHTAVPERSNGETATFTRATTKTVENNDGYLVTLLAGEIGFPGARRVLNVLQGMSPAVKSEDITTFPYRASASVTTPNANTITWTPDVYTNSGVATQVGYVPAAGVVNRTFCFSATVWVDSGTYGAQLAIIQNGVGNFYQAFTATTTPTRVQFVKAFGASATGVMGGFYNGVAGGAGTIRVTNIQLEDVTAQTTQTAGEYVSVGVESAPYYHGSMVDGVKCFGTDLAGAALTTMTRYKPEPAATQIIAATADIRDMTTANWALGATMTRARTSVGADGAANSATRLTGGAVAATNNILYTVAAAASSRTYSALVRRVTGTGPVRIIQTGTETDISSQLATTGYALVQLNASVLNVAIGFKIDTNGDAIDVDFNQFEAGATATSRIATGGGTRNADFLTYTGGNVANFKTLHAGFRREVGVSAGAYVAGISGAAGEYVDFLLNSATDFYFQGSDNSVSQWSTQASNNYTPGINSKATMSFAANDIKMDKDGVAQTADTSATIPTLTQLDVGHLQGLSPLNGNVGPVAAWTRNLSQSELGAIDA